MTETVTVSSQTLVSFTAPAVIWLMSPRAILGSGRGTCQNRWKWQNGQKLLRGDGSGEGENGGGQGSQMEPATFLWSEQAQRASREWKRGRITKLQMFRRSWMQQVLPAWTCRKHRVTWRVTTGGLCAGMGWDGDSVGPEDTNGMPSFVPLWACVFLQMHWNRSLLYEGN